jgi:hypothetical protein
VQEAVVVLECGVEGQPMNDRCWSSRSSSQARRSMCRSLHVVGWSLPIVIMPRAASGRGEKVTLR